MRRIPKRESFFSMIAGASIGFVKAGQPQLLSNLSEDEKRGNRIIPDVFSPGISQRVADAVSKSWKKER